MQHPNVTLTVRKLDVSLDHGFGRHWHGDEPFRTMYFNALSMSFPVGEQFFIDSVRAALPLLPPGDRHAALRESIAQFIGQEASHRHVHARYNAHLGTQGLVNHWEGWAHRRLARAERRHLHPLHRLAATAAYEHITAVLADSVLRHADLMAGAEPAMRTLWYWHSAEEMEHKSVAFDLYRALGGGTARRVAWFAYVLAMFVLESSAQTLLNLHADRTLSRRATWTAGFGFVFGRRGLVVRTTIPLLRYFKPAFHPDDDDNRLLAQRWLAAHAHQWRAIARPARRVR